MKYILFPLAVCTLFACNIVAKRNAARTVSTEKLDTISATPPKVITETALFETAFIRGTQEKGNIAPIPLYGINIGTIKITSGRIIACDPLHTDEYGLPYTQLFPIGEFPIQLSIAQTGEEDMVAFARIYFSDEPVVKWELALLQDQKPLSVGGDDYHGFGVDGGIGALMDAEGKKALDNSGLIDDALYDTLQKQMEHHYHNTWRYTMFNSGNYSLAAFTTGKGDGKYATYIGFDVSGKPCRLLTDFGLFNWKKK